MLFNFKTIFNIRPLATCLLIKKRVTNLASFPKTYIQNKDLTASIAEATNPRKVFLWADIIIF